EECDVGAGRALLVGIEEVVDGRVVLVDRLLDEPQPERARVEGDVLRRVTRDARHVVDAVKPHPPILPAMRAVVIVDGRLELEERPDPERGEGELRVRVQAAGVNTADLMQRAGHYPAPAGAPADIPGLE